MLEALKILAPDLITQAVIDETDKRAKRVKLYREYADGEHRANLTANMKAMLRMQNDDDRLVANYCDTVIQTMADRLVVEKIEADTEPGTAWANEVRAFNRFDGLQMDVTEAALRDADTYINVAFDNEAGLPTFFHEPAFDGTDGVIVIYDRTRRSIALAIKIWIEDGEEIKTRANFYYPDRIEKYIGDESGGNFGKYEEKGVEWPVKWTKPDGKPIGVPIIHIPNRKRGNSTHGLSELTNIVPIQDGLNRTLISMIMTAELTAFQLRYALGFEVPSDVTPGMWVNISAAIPADQQVHIGVLEQGNINDFLNQARFLIHEMGTISRTPSPEFMGGDNASGESLKQREVGLLGKVRKFQVKGGNAWEDVMVMAHRVQSAYGISKKPPEVKRFNCQWMKAEVRNDTEVVKNAKEVRPDLSREDYLKTVASVFGWDDKQIKAMVEAADKESLKRLQQAGGLIPPFGSGNGFDDLDNANNGGLNNG